MVICYFYRDGGSGNGSLMLNAYDTKIKIWKSLQDGWINVENEGSSYWQVTIDNAGIIQISWVWRET